MMNKYMNEILLLLKWYNKDISDDEFLEKFRLKKIRYRREVPNIAKEKLEEACMKKNDEMMWAYFSLVINLKIDFDEIKDSMQKIIIGD